MWRDWNPDYKAHSNWIQIIGIVCDRNVCDCDATLQLNSYVFECTFVTEDLKDLVLIDFGIEFIGKSYQNVFF